MTHDRTKVMRVAGATLLYHWDSFHAEVGRKVVHVSALATGLPDMLSNSDCRDPQKITVRVADGSRQAVATFTFDELHAVLEKAVKVCVREAVRGKRGGTAFEMVKLKKKRGRA